MKEFSFLHLFEDLMNSPDFFSKKMFGGLSLYYGSKMVAILVEDPGSTTWAKKDYKQELWYGVMIPTSQEFHQDLQKKIKTLKPHPFLKKWLYLSAREESFEEDLEKLVLLIKKRDPSVGIFPKMKRTI